MSELIAKPQPVLLAGDLDLILKLLPRAQIVVGDIPALYPTLQRIEAAAQAKVTFVPFAANDGQAS